MTKKRFLITTLMLVITGMVAGVLIGSIDGEIGEQTFALTAFCPIWFIGMYFCVFPIRRRLPMVLAVENIRIYRRKKKNDRYDICANLIGGLIFAYIVIFGWIVGLVKYCIYLYRIWHGNTQLLGSFWRNS